MITLGTMVGGVAYEINTSSREARALRKKIISILKSKKHKNVESLKSFMHFDQNEVKVVSDLTECMETVLIILHNKIK